jgi:hypothetical protein
MFPMNASSSSPIDTDYWSNRLVKITVPIVRFAIKRLIPFNYLYKDKIMDPVNFLRAMISI